MTLAQAMALSEAFSDAGTPALPWGPYGWPQFATEGHHVELAIEHPYQVAQRARHLAEIEQAAYERWSDMLPDCYCSGTRIS